jgi:hypothetical protein
MATTVFNQIHDVVETALTTVIRIGHFSLVVLSAIIAEEFNLV